MGRGNRTASQSSRRLWSRDKQPQQKLQYTIYVVNDITGKQQELTKDALFSELAAPDKPLRKIMSANNNIRLQIIEQQKGRGFTPNQRTVYHRTLAPHELTVVGIDGAVRSIRHMRTWLENNPLRRWTHMETDNHGNLHIQLLENKLDMSRTNPKPAVAVLDSLVVDPQADESTAASAEFIAAAQQSIAEYEQQRLEQDTDKLLQEEARQEKIQEAQRLQQLMQDTASQLPRQPL